MALFCMSTTGYSSVRWSAEQTRSVVKYSRRGGVEGCVRIGEVLIRERIWAFWHVPDYHQMGQHQQQQLGSSTVGEQGGRGGVLKVGGKH